MATQPGFTVQNKGPYSESSAFLFYRIIIIISIVLATLSGAWVDHEALRIKPKDSQQAKHSHSVLHCGTSLVPLEANSKDSEEAFRPLGISPIT